MYIHTYIHTYIVCIILYAWALNNRSCLAMHALTLFVCVGARQGNMQIAVSGRWRWFASLKVPYVALWNLRSASYGQHEHSIFHSVLVGGEGIAVVSVSFSVRVRTSILGLCHLSCLQNTYYELCYRNCNRPLLLLGQLFSLANSRVGTADLSQTTKTL